MKILAITPNYRCGGAEISVGILPPLGLLYSLSPVLNDGHRVKLLDAMRLRLSFDKIGVHIESEAPDVVCVGSPTSTATINRAIQILKQAKTNNPSIYTILGGLHPTFMFQEIMHKNPEIDFIVRGEGEITLRELIQVLEGKDFENLSHIKGIVWRNKEQLVVNDEREKIKDLDAIHPAWVLVEDWGLYRNAITNEISATIQFSRGCPGKCAFCCLWAFWQRYRTREPASFVDELQMLNERHQVTFFFLADESAATNQMRWLELLRDIVSRGLRIHIFAALRVGDIIRDKKYLPLYKRAGIAIINLGIECTTQEGLDRYHKKTKVADNRLAIQLIKQNGILSVANLFVGEPHETPASLKDKFAIMREWGPDFVMPYIPMPFPWTPFFSSAKDRIITLDWEKWNFMNPVLKLDHMDVNTLFRTIIDNWASIQLNPKRLLDIFSNKSRYLRRYLLMGYLKHLPFYFYQRFRLGKVIEKFGSSRLKNRVYDFYGQGV